MAIYTSVEKTIKGATEHLNGKLDDTESVKQAIINAFEANGFVLRGVIKKSKLGGYYVDCGYGMPRTYTKLVEVERISEYKRLMKRERHNTTNQIILDDDYEFFINSLEIAIHEAKVRRGDDERIPRGYTLNPDEECEPDERAI